MNQFEFHAYSGDENGVIVEVADVTITPKLSESAALARAGRLAKRINGPVDVAFAGSGKWDIRYVTTASPSDFHTSGYRFERIV